MFSGRLPRRLTQNALSQAIAAWRRTGRRLVDLTETNPTNVGLPYPDDLASALTDPRNAAYHPSAFGMDEARQAVAALYPGVSPERVVLTSSTSEAYSLLFKLLCDPGDEVLVPRPSYPLFELLTRLDGVTEVPYRLDGEAAWAIERDGLEHALTTKTRAILVVSPNNPTGSMLRRGDREWLVDLAGRHELALVSDEVFADYPLAPKGDAVSLAGEQHVLTFTLGGLSKSAGLPQMKLAWIIVSGPGPVVTEALLRLAIIADSYLSVATPVQVGVARLLESGAAIRRSIRLRLARNLDVLRAAAGGAPAVTLFEPEGGWSAVLRVPAILSGDEFVLRLLARSGVMVHPGYFFDLEGEGFLVVSLLPRPEVFAEGIGAVVDLVREVSR